MFHLDWTYGYGCQSKEVVTIGFLVFIHLVLSLCKNISLILLRGTELWISRFFLNIKSVLKIFGKSTKLKEFVYFLFLFFWCDIFRFFFARIIRSVCFDFFREVFVVRKMSFFVWVSKWFFYNFPKGYDCIIGLRWISLFIAIGCHHRGLDEIKIFRCAVFFFSFLLFFFFWLVMFSLFSRLKYRG